MEWNVRGVVKFSENTTDRGFYSRSESVYNERNCQQILEKLFLQKKLAPTHFHVVLECMSLNTSLSGV